MSYIYPCVEVDRGRSNSPGTVNWLDQEKKKLSRSKRKVCQILAELRARCDPPNTTPGVSRAGSRLMDVTCAGLLATAGSTVGAMVQATSPLASKSHRRLERRENPFSCGDDKSRGWIAQDERLAVLRLNGTVGCGQRARNTSKHLRKRSRDRAPSRVPRGASRSPLCKGAIT